MPILLVDNYDSFTYNLFQMVQAEVNAIGGDDAVVVHRNDALTLDDVLAMKPSRVILSPGPGHPAIGSDFGVCRDIILHADKLGAPILGVCLGHQGMACHLGGQVIQAPAIVHGKTSLIRYQGNSPLLEGLSNPFQAMRYHSLVVSDERLPDVLEVLAHDDKDGLIMAMQHRSLPMYGVQFHPESIGTPEGARLLRNFVERC
jgi:anthranilate synthase/aminodeoxychorismate synthase-like glutamine amidotransferase